jgi:hypothetical protein
MRRLQLIAAHLIPTFWLLALMAGIGGLAIYSGVAGMSSPMSVGLDWPTKSALVSRNGLPTLVLFLHPKCPCTAATVAELAELMPKLAGKTRVHAVFAVPPGKSLSWARSGLWKSAGEIPGVEPSFDEQGLEAKLFGAKTSGQVLLFDEQGRLVFRGGITPARGHQGDSIGKAAIAAWITGRRALASSSPVFGCALSSDLKVAP